MKVRKTAYAIVAALLAVVLLRCFVATPYLIPSVGMENSLYRGERILVNKWSYGLRLPFMAWWGYHRWPDRPVKQGDIVVFNNPGNLSQPVVDRRETFISRCIGTPGDTLLIDSLFDVVPDMPQAIVHKPKPLIVPGRGATLRVYPWNRTLLCNTLVLHEGKRAEIKGDTLFVEGKPVHFCRFSKDYYWVTANNAANLNDSRLFGFVPKDHIIGKAAVIWFSKKEDTDLFSGYRWERMWTRVQ